MSGLLFPAECVPLIFKEPNLDEHAGVKVGINQQVLVNTLLCLGEKFSPDDPRIAIHLAYRPDEAEVETEERKRFATAYTRPRYELPSGAIVRLAVAYLGTASVAPLTGKPKPKLRSEKLVNRSLLHELPHLVDAADLDLMKREFQVRQELEAELQAREVKKQQPGLKGWLSVLWYEGIVGSGQSLEYKYSPLEVRSKQATKEIRRKVGLPHIITYS